MVVTPAAARADSIFGGLERTRLMSHPPPVQHFSSLAACLEYVRGRFNDRSTVSIDSVKDIAFGTGFDVDVPAFLYRGENSAYPSTVSSMQRLKNDQSVSIGVREEIEQGAIALDQEMQKFMALNQMLSTGFVQHYGGPSELLDFTSRIDVAGFFASRGVVGQTGLFCVVPMQVAGRRSIVIDLSQHPRADRPRRQAAYAFYHRSHRDLKDAACIREWSYGGSHTLFSALTLARSTRVRRS
jgi:hypothetical protein